MITVDTFIGVFGLCGTFFSLGLALGLFLGNTKKQPPDLVSLAATCHKYCEGVTVSGTHSFLSAYSVDH